MDFRLKQFPKLPSLPRADRSLRALVDRAPQAEDLANRGMDKLLPLRTWLYQSRRRLATGAVVVLAGWLSLHVLFGANGMVVYRQKRAEYDQLQKQLTDLQQENSHYNSQIKSLKNDPGTMERAAREQLHYTRPGEVVYVGPPPAHSQPPANAAARK
jgi:cell division protein FtsB